MYASTKARSREGMPGVCRGYFGTSPYRDPPSFSPTPTPIFSTPSIGEDTLLRQVCDSYASLVSNVNNQRVGTCTQEKVIETFGTSSTHPLPLFSDESIQVFLFPAPADNISLHDVHLSNAAFCGFRSPAVVFIEPTPPLSSDHNYFQ